MYNGGMYNIKFTAAKKRARYNVLVTWWSRDTKVFLSAKKIALQ